MNKTSSIGRPRREELTNLIKFSVDSDTGENIKALSKQMSKPISEIMREIVPLISSKDYESMLSNTSLENLQFLSDKCWNTLHTEAAVFETDKISQVMPAFITKISSPHPMIHVKYPTFKIDIYGKGDPTIPTESNKIEKILNGIDKRSQVYLSQANYIICGNQIRPLEFPFISEVQCLATNIGENKETKQKIIERLSENGYLYSVFPAYCLRSEIIEILEDGRYFRLLNATPQ